MILKGRSRRDAVAAVNYLLEKDGNESARLIAVENTLSQDPHRAAEEMEVIAGASRALNPFYHFSINPPQGVHLTPEQQQRAVAISLEELKLSGHQSIVVEHDQPDEDRAHLHVFVNRVNPETLKAVRMSHNYRAHERAARKMEKEFGLEHVQGVHVREDGEERPDRAPTDSEMKQGKKTGVGVRKWREEVQAIAEAVKEGSGADLIAALEAKGHIVAKGDKIGFILLDPTGAPHRMAQSLGFARVKDLKEKLADIDRDKLPNELEARERQKEILKNLPEQEAKKEQAKQEGRPEPEAEKKKQEQEREKREKIEYRHAATMYGRGGMVAQQMAALKDAKRRNEKLNDPFQPTRPDLQKKEEEQRRQQEEAARYQSSRAGNRKEEGTKADDIRDRTEQTDSKQARTHKDIMREIRESARAARDSARDRGDEWERERERER